MAEALQRVVLAWEVLREAAQGRAARELVVPAEAVRAREVLD